jgi:hypothetical protein
MHQKATKMLADRHKKRQLEPSRNRTKATSHPTTRMAKACKPTMTYYQRLLHHVEETIKQHPKSTVVLDTSTFKVLAAGTNLAKIKEKLKTVPAGTVSVIAEQHKGDHITLLCRR